jgi:hypothetical protein
MNFQNFYNSIDKNNCISEPVCPIRDTEQCLVKIPPPIGNIPLMLISRDPPDYYYKKNKAMFESDLSDFHRRDKLMSEGVPKWVIRRIISFNERNHGKIPQHHVDSIEGLQNLLDQSYWTHLCKCFTINKKWSEECGKIWLYKEVKAVSNCDLKIIIPLGKDVTKTIYEIMESRPIKNIEIFPLPHHSGSNFDWTRDDRSERTAMLVNDLLEWVSINYKSIS